MLHAHLFVDLYQVVRHGIRASVESYSIKRSEPFYGFERETALTDATALSGSPAARWNENRKMPLVRAAYLTQAAREGVAGQIPTRGILGALTGRRKIGVHRTTLRSSAIVRPVRASERTRVGGRV
jgi:hypothetical protein